MQEFFRYFPAEPVFSDAEDEAPPAKRAKIAPEPAEGEPSQES